MNAYLLGALVFGWCVPYVARRFAKFMPATLAGALVETVRWQKKAKGYRSTLKYRQFLWRSLMMGLVCTAVTQIGFEHFGAENFWVVAFYLWMLLLMAEVDYRTYLLPDILTVPLLLVGFLVSSLDIGFVSYGESAVGAMLGYFLPVAVSLLIVWRDKDAFGGGDVKLLAALGAWLGVYGVLYVILSASVLGLLYAFVKKKKSLAFGPMIALAGMIVALCFY